MSQFTGEPAYSAGGKRPITTKESPIEGYKVFITNGENPKTSTRLMEGLVDGQWHATDNHGATKVGEAGFHGYLTYETALKYVGSLRSYSIYRAQFAGYTDTKDDTIAAVSIKIGDLVWIDGKPVNPPEDSRTIPVDRKSPVRGYKVVRENEDWTITSPIYKKSTFEVGEWSSINDADRSINGAEVGWLGFHGSDSLGGAVAWISQQFGSNPKGLVVYEADFAGLMHQRDNTIAAYSVRLNNMVWSSPRTSVTLGATNEANKSIEETANKLALADRDREIRDLNRTIVSYKVDKIAASNKIGQQQSQIENQRVTIADLQNENALQKGRIKNMQNNLADIRTAMRLLNNVVDQLGD